MTDLQFKKGDRVIYLPTGQTPHRVGKTATIISNGNYQCAHVEWDDGCKTPTRVQRSRLQLINAPLPVPAPRPIKALTISIDELHKAVSYYLTVNHHIAQPVDGLEIAWGEVKITLG
jgi:hypothetical protein